MLKITVLQEDIDESRRLFPDGINTPESEIHPTTNYSCSCPLSLAGYRQHGKRTSTTARDIAVGDALYYHTKKSRRFIEKFDTGKDVNPDSFTFRVRGA